MAHIRLFKHYIPTQFLLLAALEFALLIGSVYAGQALRLGARPEMFVGLLPSALVFATVITLANVSMGVYAAHLREGYSGMVLRTAVAFFLIGSIGISLIFYIVPELFVGRGSIAISTVVAFTGTLGLRYLMLGVLDEELLRKRVLVLGAGARAVKIATRLRRRSDQRAFVLHAFARLPGTDDQVSAHGARVVELTPEQLHAYCDTHQVEEIVIALDERRRREGDNASAGLPLDALLDCRLSGIEVIDLPGFFEREVGKVELDLLHPSWLVFAEGFANHPMRDAAERLLDITVSTIVLLLTWPIMLLAALAISLESRFREPVFYRQTRVGLNGRHFDLIKFRSMTTDAEKEGKAVWAAKNDPRVTTVGRFLRSSRIDELPQILCVLRGDMSFVGPRPERPEFVEQLAQQIPYYRERHRVKPGITGWAQLCYPYGASVEDAVQKHQYDLYYLKNHSVLLDLIILIQTIEVVLVGDGAR